MKKLSAKSIEKIELFLYMEDMNYISLSRHDMELFYSIYNKSVMELLDLEQENQKLKKQLEEYIRAEFKAKDELEKQRQEYQEVYKDVREEIKDYKGQQKEFIEYLENEINMCDGFLDTIKNDLEEVPYAGRVAGKTYIATQIMKNETSKKTYEDILSKYKEIIGGDNK